jgi:hypothetical protein
MPRLAVVAFLLAAGCPTREEPPATQPRGIADPAGTIKETKAAAQEALDASERRNADAFDRAMQGEAPSTRSAR